MSFFLMAGPCVIETRESAFDIAHSMKGITDKLQIPYIFKASFDKANRSSIESYRGVGIDKGLQILADIKNELNLRVMTDIHTAEQAAIAAEAVDVLQIPAFLARQTDIVIAAAKTGNPVNIKKPQFFSPFDMKNVIDKFKSTGNEQLMVCERGTCFGYNTLIVDMTGLYEMGKFGCPVVFDATHSVQKPGANGKSTGGNREYVRYLARAAVAVGIDGLFMEVHPEPDTALSDGPNMVPLSDIAEMLKEFQRIHEIVRG
jgi:2-dehydro-3-deoxyphosphooctonate aldolase (KDO 8-P synthase)